METGRSASGLLLLPAECDAQSSTRMRDVDTSSLQLECGESIRAISGQAERRFTIARLIRHATGRTDAHDKVAH